VLLGIKGVAMVTVFGEPTPRELIEKLLPDVLIKGADYREEDVVGGDIVKAAGGRVALIELVEGHSTSALVRRATEGEG
jgi:D-beta-D-heptose 7-phosphate kinase/D-beta-D-heptose 1-phosphate adenosyltransferase